MAGLSKCQSSVSRGKVVSWKGSKNLWITSNVTIDTFGKTAEHVFCGRKGLIIKIESKISNICYYLLANTNPKVIIHFFIDEIQTDFREKPYYLVVFPEKRTVEMGQTICQMHGGHLPVPTNKIENEVKNADMTYYQ